eukprot:gene13611-5380_t
MLHLLLVLTVGQRVDVPWGGGGCETDWDCSLGGECYAPTPGQSIPEVKADLDNATKWHLYASFMCNHKSLSEWTTVSSSGHFIGDSPVGPFEFSPEQCKGEVCTPTIIPWSHNTVAMHNTDADATDAWQIWHIGDGIVNASVFSPCFNKSEVGAVDLAAAAAAASAAASWGGHAEAATVASTDAGQEVYISSAATPSGPWKREFNNGNLDIRFDPNGAWPQGATNPSPLMLPNGSIRLYFTDGDEKNPCGLVSNCIGVAQSDSGWK